MALSAHIRRFKEAEAIATSKRASTLREAKDDVQHLKATGQDDIGAELIMMHPEKLVACLHRLIVRF